MAARWPLADFNILKNYLLNLRFLKDTDVRMDQTVISDSWFDDDNDTKSLSKSRWREHSVKIKGIS